MKNLLTFSGVLTNSEFFKWFLLTNLTTVGGFYFLGLGVISLELLYLILMIVLWITCVTTTKRIRDMGLSGWHVITFFVLSYLIANVAQFLCLVFQIVVLFGIGSNFFTREKQ
jgi:uncharacterized membrane protein YhaH (DUF805 family)